MRTRIRRCALTMLAGLAAATIAGHANALPSPPKEGTEPTDEAVRGDRVALVRAAADEGKLAWKLTEVEEVRALLGPPTEESTEIDGGMEVLILDYPQVRAVFGRMRETSAPFTLLWLGVSEQPASPDSAQEGRALEEVDIGRGRKLVLRNEKDLKKLDDFWGFANVSLGRLDLRKHGELLRRMPFDSLTEWPLPEKLPKGFYPERLLESGKDPGLGIRGLHTKGIDGRGVRIAIIDQPLNVDHSEFADRLEAYEAIGTEGVEVQMHGAPVASIAVGRTCGVAPRASLSYFAVAMWARDNDPYCECLEAIIESNQERKPAERIRVVSISTGMFEQQNDYERWKEVLRRAEESGVLVITCARHTFTYGTCKRRPGRDPDDPANYVAGKYGVEPGALLVPAGNRTTASHRGPEAYTYWTDGGMSWATPYVAGIAALAFQVDPTLTPEVFIRILRESATKIDAGLVVNPPGLIEAVRARAEK